MVVSGFLPKRYYTRTCAGGQRHLWAERKRERRGRGRWGGRRGKETGEGDRGRREVGVSSINGQTTAKE